MCQALALPVHGVLSVVAVAVPASLGGMYTPFSSRFFTGRRRRRVPETRYIGQRFFTQGAVPRVS